MAGPVNPYTKGEKKILTDIAIVVNIIKNNLPIIGVLINGKM